MSGRRLPLHASVSPASSPLLLGALRVPGRAIAVADTQRGDLALRWAARLVRGLTERGAAPRVLLTSFDAWIDLSPTQRDAFGDTAVLHSLALGSGAGLPADLPADPRALWVLVGQPALLSFDSSLRVLLGTAVPVLRWPENMRSLRTGCTLALGSEGLEIASALATLLPLK